MPEGREDKRLERERRVQEVFDALIDGREKDHAAREERPEAWLEERLEGLPARARTEVLAYDRALEDDGITDPAKRERHVEAKLNAFEQTYQDRRFTVGEGDRMLKQEFAKEQALEWLNAALEGEPSPDDLRKVALLNFDANGLKAVNDLSGSHEKGTEYLRRIAEIFHADDTAAAAWLRSRGIKDLLPVTGGGDEYSVMIRADAPIDQETIDTAVRLFEEAIEGIAVRDLVDFADDATRLRYLGVSEARAAGLSAADRANALEKMDEVPAGFEMRASASGGGRTLYDGLLAALEHPTKPIAPGDSFARASMKMVGGMWDAADAAALQSKLSYKEGLRDGAADASDRFYAKVLARTSEARVLESQVESLQLQQKKMETMESELAELDAMLDSGAVDEASYGRTMRSIRKKYRPAA